MPPVQAGMVPSLLAACSAPTGVRACPSRAAWSTPTLAAAGRAASARLATSRHPDALRKLRSIPRTSFRRKPESREFRAALWALDPGFRRGGESSKCSQIDMGPPLKIVGDAGLHVVAVAELVAGPA